MPMSDFEFMRKAWEKFRPELCLESVFGSVDCGKKIVQAHSISKKAGLEKIAIQGHVYGYKKTPMSLHKNNGKMVLERVGINSASTFTGFCDKHDSGLFSDIDNKELIPNKFQCLLLHYRTLGRELYAKGSQAYFLKKFEEANGRGVSEWEDSPAESADKGLLDVGEGYAKIRRAILEGHHDRFSARVFRFSKRPGILCSSAIFPEVDFLGNGVLERWRMDPGERLPLISFHLLPQSTGGCLIFVFPKEIDGPCHKLSESLVHIPDNLKTTMVCNLIFEYSENIFANIEWWDSIKKAKKAYLANKVAVSFDHSFGRAPDCLSCNPGRIDDWTFLGSDEV